MWRWERPVQEQTDLDLKLQGHLGARQHQQQLLQKDREQQQQQQQQQGRSCLSCRPASAIPKCWQRRRCSPF